MEEVKIVDEVFSINPTEDRAVFGAYRVGVSGPTVVGLSVVHPQKARSKRAKINRTAQVLEELLAKQNMNALYIETSKTLYMEYENESESFSCIFSEGCIKWLGQKPAKPSYIGHLAPVMFQGIFESYYGAGITEMADMMGRINQNITEEDLLRFCDGNYYSWVTQMMSQPLTCNVISREEWMRYQEAEEFTQALRTKNYVQLTDMVPELFVKEFTHIKVSKEGQEPVSSANGVVVTYEKCCAGEFLLNFDWGEAAEKIPSIHCLDEFVPNTAFYKVVRKAWTKANAVMERMDAGLIGTDAILSDYINALLVGRPGTGKTTMAKAICATLGIPLYVVPLSKNKEEDTFEGMTKVVDGEFKFVETNFLKGFEYGGMIVLEEANLADPAVVMGALGQAIEAPFLLNKNGYEEVYRHPLCLILATMNTGTNGSKPLSQAFSSRFKNTYILDDPKKKDFMKILSDHHSDHGDCEKVYRYYNRIVEELNTTYSAPEIALSLTLRQCIGALEDMEEGSTLKEALYDTMIGKIAESDLEIAMQINEAVVETAID